MSVDKANFFFREIGRKTFVSSNTVEQSVRWPVISVTVVFIIIIVTLRLRVVNRKKTFLFSIVTIKKLIRHKCQLNSFTMEKR